MELGSGPCTGADLAAMVELMVACRKAGKASRFPSVADLRRFCRAPGAGWTLHAWTNRHGSLVSFAVMNLRWGSLYFFVDPVVDARSRAREMIEWALRRRADTGPPGAELRCTVRGNDVATLGLLPHLGFTRHEHHLVHVTRPLDRAIPSPVLPSGFEIRSVEGEHEVAPYVEMHRDAFGTLEMTEESRLADMRDEAYLPELDLVVVDPSGQLVAFCVGSIDVEENAHMGWREGWTDPIGTRPAFRRCGLARAAVSETLRRLRERGMETAIVGTGSWNVAMLQLLKSIGYQQLYELQWWVKSAAAPP